MSRYQFQYTLFLHWVLESKGSISSHSSLPTGILKSASGTVHHCLVPGSILTLPLTPQNVGLSLRKLIGSVDEILPILPATSRTEVGLQHAPWGWGWGRGLGDIPSYNLCTSWPD